MRIYALLLLPSVLTGFAVPAEAQKQPTQAHRILSAKTVYFDDKIPVDAMREKALSELKKWGRFQIVASQQGSDLILVLSADPYKGGHVIFGGGQTGTINSKGEIDVDAVPNYNKQSPVRYAYLTVVEAKSGDTLWSDSCRWGGLLTGFNSAGARLIKRLEKDTRK